MYHLYARVSTSEQVSCPDQLQKTRAVAALRGGNAMDCCEYTDEGVSGSVPLGERPNGKVMLDACREGDTIVAVKLDRLFRSAADALTTAEALKKRKVQLILIDLGVDPVTDNGTAKLFFGMLSLMAEFERGLINERCADGRRAKRARRGYMGGHVPYGCNVVGRGRDAILVEDPQAVEIRTAIRRMVEDGHKTSRIARYLTKYHPTRSGKPWQQVQVDRILNRG